MKKSEKIIARELKEIQKYVVAMTEIAVRCEKKQHLHYKNLQYEYHLQPIAIKALCNMGYIERVSMGKYNWKASMPVTPLMARRLYDWMKEYFSSSKLRQKEMLSEKLFEKDNNTDPVEDVDTSIKETPIESNINYEYKEPVQEKIPDQVIKIPRKSRSVSNRQKSSKTIKVIKIFGLPIISITIKTIAYE